MSKALDRCIAAQQATPYPYGLRAFDLPSDVHEVIVLADGDDPGEAAARAAAIRWKLEGRTVGIARPPKGCEFNDLLLGRVPGIEEDAS